MSGAMQTAAPSGNKPMTPQENYVQRMALMHSNQGQLTIVATQTAAMGSSVRQNLNNTGITTGVWIDVSIPITSTNTAATALTPVQGAPWTALSLINVKDYNNINRSYLTGYQLFRLNTRRRWELLGLTGLDGFPKSFGSQYGGPGGNFSSVPPGLSNFSLPNIPTSVPANSTTNLTFSLYCPIAYQGNPRLNKRGAPNFDLRGAIVSQTSIGNLSVTVNLAQSLFQGATAAPLTAPYSGAQPAGITVGTASLTFRQEWLSPQRVGGVYPNPALDLLTVYELQGNIVDNSNLVANQVKWINYPPVRETLGFYMDYVNGTAINNGTDITEIDMVVNSNNVWQQWTPEGLALENRLKGDVDMPQGAYDMTTRQKPVQVALAGNVQVKFTPNSVATGAYLLELFENFYPIGMQLPGVVNGS